jgi:tRNA/rRNA methyltransferase
MNDDRLQTIQIILVEPAGARNVGSIARVMKNMGLSRLVLINPKCDYQSDEARHMAVHATDVLAQAVVYPHLADALQGVHRVVATLGRDSDRPVESPRTLAPWLLEQHPDTQIESAIIFGREDHGLSNDELKYAQRYLCIPTSAEYQSLNLAQSVGICCYELSQVSHVATNSPATSSPAAASQIPLTNPTLATLGQLEGYFEQLETLLLKIGYLYPHTADSRMATLRELLKRSDPSSQDVAMLRGMIRQVEWALKNSAQNSTPSLNNPDPAANLSQSS